MRCRAVHRWQCAAAAAALVTSGLLGTPPAASAAPRRAAAPSAPARRDLAPAGAFYVPTTPCRIVDTRVNGGPLGANATRAFAVTGTGAAFAAQGGKAGGCGVPSTAVAVQASITAVSPTAGGYLRAWPAGSPAPTATFLNFAKGASTTNSGSLAIATSGTKHLQVRNWSAGANHLVIDVQGYFDPTAGAEYVPITPCRVVDTRLWGALPATPPVVPRWISIYGSLTQLQHQGGNPKGCPIPTGIVAIEASISVVNPKAGGYLRAYPYNTPMPTATFLNFTKGVSTTNTGTIPLTVSPDMQLEVVSFSSARTDIVIDVQGYFAGSAVGGTRFVPQIPCRIADTRAGGGAVAAQGQRSLTVTGSGAAFAAQGGKAGGCAIPAGAEAVQASITAVTPSAAGYLRAWPVGTPMPTATALNFAKAISTTNTGTVTIAVSGEQQLQILNASGDVNHFVIDVQGYFQ
jgi:hypothetical protein